MWLILQNSKPEDFVIATGVQHTVREFATLAFRYAGIELRWEGSGVDERGIDVKTGRTVVAVSRDFYRPTDVVNLWGDPSKAKRELGWNPQSTSFEQLVQIMVKHDMEKVAADHVASVMRTNLAEYLEKGIVR
jgi:GDPmannose 4,6-dehydratase